MNTARTPLAEDEIILRRIHKNQVKAGPPPLVSYVAFRPTADDVDGLSVFRERLISATEVAASGRKSGEYYVARLSVKALRDLGLTAVQDELPDGPLGHALIPELTPAACQADKIATRTIQIRLADLANKNIIVEPMR